jgi:DNA modification methylase
MRKEMILMNNLNFNIEFDENISDEIIKNIQDYIFDLGATYITHNNDIQQLEKNKIYCCDCRNKFSLLKNNLFDCIIIDPPYSGSINKTKSGTRMRQDKGNHIDYDDMIERVFLQFMNPIMKELYRVCNLGGHFYCFTDWKQLRNMMDLIELASFKITNIICWDKQQIGLGGGYRPQYEFIIVGSKGLPHRYNRKDLGNVIRCKRVYKKTHPHEKPEELIETLISNSCKEGDFVLDSFCGTGVVPVVCKKNKIDFMAFELSQSFVDIGNDKLNTYE